MNAIGALVAQPPKLNRIEYNKYLTDTINDQAFGLRDLRKIGNTAADAYAAALAASTPEIKALQENTIGRLGSLADQYSTFDPTATYERVRGGNIASLADQFVKLASAGEEGDKLALAARGYGGRGPGSYESILRADRISRNIAPVLNTIYGNLGTDTTGLNLNRLANLGNVIPTLAYRDALPGATDARTLLPYEARLSMLGREIPLSTQIAESTRANTAGFKETPNKWASFLDNLGRSMDQGFDAFTSLYGGGMLGAFGGNPGTGPGLDMQGKGPGAGGGGSNGGINSNQVIQLLLTLLASRGGGGGGGGGLPSITSSGSPSSFPY